MTAPEPRPYRRPFRRRPVVRIRGLTINRLLPNILTTLALCAGLTAIRYAIQGRWEQAVTAILVAAVLDGLDGRVARLLRGSSKFGAELDSLADIVSFGVSPAIILYLWMMQGAGSFGWLAVMAYAVCAALRLARFNTALDDADSLPPFAYNYFTGVPVPAGAILILMPLMISFEFAPGFWAAPVLVGVWTVFVALLLVSRIPTFSMKVVRIPQEYIVPVLVGVGLVATLLVTATWPTLVALGLIYVGSILFSIRRYAHLKRQAALMMGVEDDAPDVDPEPPADQPPSAPSPV
ncbi:MULTISPECIES: CDP-diacylglycerol--serine O-phosphatidyltransferase [Inquilinus]|uniref:CDP-diacylglycerol--serine O-phosphatidyltransferase n=1 Tax=Inquilinus ginsengisoli TaxID=363840 RepID=A0ABU1JW19_9PROT|nr:CDP-diacylglycerol--serine O-phosphatidyltransferase [Inquilinus ginsengisoli]MDR6292816.1 CDP-diacylglycerol--serine O-phosphatidyltransferase [Inquilinus ginsengisoli]